MYSALTLSLREIEVNMLDKLLTNLQVFYLDTIIEREIEVNSK